MELKGIHHVSAMTANAEKNLDFYTNIMGMRLVKKTVNQDDTSMYHLFYGDEKGNPGTELTFFEIPMLAKNHEGVRSISAISLRVKNDEALKYWKARFEEFGVKHEDIMDRANRKTIAFADPEGQQLILVSDEENNGVAAGVPWKLSTVPVKSGITGLGPVKLTVQHTEPTENVLTNLMGFRRKGTYPSPYAGQHDIIVFETGEGGSGAEIHLEERNDLPATRLGRGGVHHVAFRVDDEKELHEWIKKIRAARLPNSGFVERFYFKSFYFREPNGILFELATDGPGFATDEHIDNLGETLALPPYLEDQRAEIEAKLAPLHTKN